MISRDAGSHAHAPAAQPDVQAAAATEPEAAQAPTDGQHECRCTCWVCRMTPDDLIDFVSERLHDEMRRNRRPR